MKEQILLALTLLLLSGSAWAEGGTCPPGYYPVNAPGVMGCAPIPDYESGDDQQPREPQARWATRWGAIAFDQEVGQMGAATSMRSKRAAKNEAIASCRSRGGGDGCRYISLTYYNQCAVVAWGAARAVTQSAESIEIASELALRKCSKLTNDCLIYYTGCSLPERIQ